jgi:flagellin
MPEFFRKEKIKSRRITIMGFRIQNNLSAMNAQRNLGISDTAMGKSLERLSSGFRINSAKDDAAGLAISQGFRANIASTKVAQRNITEANALLQTAEGAMSSIGDILTRMKELATQAASANAATDINKVSAEYNTLVLEIDRIAGSTKYGGTALVNGTFAAGGTLTAGSSTWDDASNVYDINVANAAAGAYTVAYTNNVLTVTSGNVSEAKTISAGAQTVNFGTFNLSFKTTTAATTAAIGAAMAGVQTVASTGSKDFQIGYEMDGNSKIGVTLDSVTSATLVLASGDISTAGGAYTALGKIDTAVGTLATSRGAVGSYQNRLGYASANLAITLENFTAAESAIRDVDMAAEMTSFTKNQILVQAGTAMLAQANMSSQGVLSLFK